MTPIPLKELKTRLVALPDDVGHALRKSGLVSATRMGAGRWQIRPKTKVGVANVAGMTLLIRPKVDVRRILFLLGYAKRPEWRDDDIVELPEVPDLVPAMAHLFVVQAERALAAGVLQGYAEVEDSSTVLRGRLREQDQLRHRFGVALPLLVRFDDHTVDVPENQLLRAAAEALLRVPQVPPPTRARLQRLRLTLIDATLPGLRQALPRWEPNRLNTRYHDALRLAEVVLRDNAVDQAPGDVRVTGFLVEMAKVYEDFVTIALTRALGEHGGRCRSQDRHHLDEDDRLVVQPDLVWYVDDRPTAVVDAKYKAQRPKGFPEADLYQMLAYCAALHLPEGHLVYAKGNAIGIRHRVRHAGTVINVHTLDLDVDPSDLLAQMTGLARRIAAFDRG